MFDLDRPLIRIAIVSDIHAFASKDKASDSVQDFSRAIPGSTPLCELADEIERQGRKADVLACAGDICNQADFGGLERAWAELHRLRGTLCASEVIATCGNHDLDSRYLSNETDPDPKGALLSLSPCFPFADPALTDKFWARNYAVFHYSKDVVISVLNTSAYHGGKQDEVGHGRISKRTIDALVAELKGFPVALTHVLVCHHHPLPLSGTARTTDTEFMRNGQDLLDGIVKATGTSWLIIHGHRHKPRLIHGASSTNAVPFVLGAGSLGARITGVPNQFHIASLYTSHAPEHASIVGRVETWSWNESSGWSSSAQSDGLPPICGFGYRGQIRALARGIAVLVGGEFLSWEDIRSNLPSVDFLMPDALRELEIELEKLQLNILRHRGGHFHQVGR
ncbi:MAG: metallophosphoesterase [Candidatus Accumulibacter sp.]|uniref:Metallophosphoesterase n=1 Tax=Candidatus Accumulibacter affinis TaxID=2954384 RepID=A0A935TL68_9PROT|nr:metallophosphoesterase [Candidatus Accumulibacter affinis]